MNLPRILLLGGPRNLCRRVSMACSAIERKTLPLSFAEALHDGTLAIFAADTGFVETDNRQIIVDDLNIYVDSVDKAIGETLKTMFGKDILAKILIKRSQEELNWHPILIVEDANQENLEAAEYLYQRITEVALKPGDVKWLILETHMKSETWAPKEVPYHRVSFATTKPELADIEKAIPFLAQDTVP